MQPSSALPNAWCPRRRRGVVLRTDSIRAAVLVIQPERVGRLNASAAQILELCDGSQCVDEIVATLSELHPETPRDVIAVSVGRFVAAARSERWIE